jgi:hypothetical protein
MNFKKILGAILIVFGLVSVALPFTREFAVISLFLIAFGAVTIVREIGGRERVRNLLRSMRRPYVPDSAASSRRIDPLLPVRVLKLADARAGVLTVSAVAMALNVGLDECQLALDELVRKGAANVDVDISTGVASYVFPEFLPHTIEGAGPL